MNNILREQKDICSDDYPYTYNENQTEFGFVAPIVKEQADRFTLDYSDKDEDYRPAYAQHDCIKLQSSRDEDVEAWREGEGKPKENPRQVKMQWGISDLALFQQSKTQDLKKYVEKSLSYGAVLPLKTIIRTWAVNRINKVGLSEENIKKYAKKLRTEFIESGKYYIWGGKGRGSLVFIRLKSTPKKGGKTLKKECTVVHSVLSNDSTVNKCYIVNTARGGQNKKEFCIQEISAKTRGIAYSLPKTWTAIEQDNLQKTDHIPHNLAKAMQQGYAFGDMREAYYEAIRRINSLRNKPKYRDKPFAPALFGKIFWQHLDAHAKKPDPQKYRGKAINGLVTKAPTPPEPRIEIEEEEPEPTFSAPQLTARQQWAIDKLNELKAKGYFDKPEYHNFAIMELQKFAHDLPEAQQAELTLLLKTA